MRKKIERVYFILSKSILNNADCTTVWVQFIINVERIDSPLIWERA